MEESTNKGKSISIVVILLAIVIGFGFVIGLTQTTGANNFNKTESEISNYTIDETGKILSYTGSKTTLEIPTTYSYSNKIEDVEMSSSSIYTLIDRANNLGIKEYSIKNDTGNYEDDYGNVYYQEKYTLTYQRKQIIEGTDYTVTGIGANAFQNNTKIVSVILPETVTTIGNNAFMGCTNLKTITLPEHLERIESSAFYNCRLLEEISIPDTVNYIGSQAFAQCQKIKSVNIPDITYIYDMTFYNCTGLETVTIPNSVRTINYEAFYGCTNLREVNFGNGLERINNMAFYNCYNLREVSLPETLNEIGSQAFYRCTTLSKAVLNGYGIVNIYSNSFPTTIQEIYVQDALVGEYPNYSNWYQYVGVLRPISDLQVA